jgi:predicted transcriptional regulator
VTEVKQTSLLSYSSIIRDGTAKSQRERIFEHVQTNPDGLTREEIRDRLGIMYTSVCGRVRALVKSGLLYENKDDIRINKSGKKALILRSY